MIYLKKIFSQKLRKNFNHFDDVMSKEKIIYGSQQFTELLNKIEDAFKFYPDDHLFFPYGPIQAPFKESVKEFIDVAIDTGKMESRRMFRMGIVAENVLIGCFTIDFNKHKILGYPNETTGDPGIFIIPEYRKNKNNGLERWKEVFSLATTIVKRFYPFNEQEILISATTHRVNRETGHILENGFTEYEGAVLHGNYGARRFFTINRKDFINKFNLEKSGYEGIIE